MGSLLPDGDIDTCGMFEATAGLPEQVAAAVATADSIGGLPAVGGIEHILVLGMGGSGIAGDVLRVIAGQLCPLPILVSHGYELPNYVSSSTLCFAVSFSGNTEETVEATQEAIAADANVVVVASGGTLADIAATHDLPMVQVDASIPQPRAAIGALAIPALVVLDDLGIFPGARRYIATAVEQLTRRRDALVGGDDLARMIAKRIGRSMPVIYGGGDLGGLAAARWKTQVNENAKAPAFANVIPELTHNEIAGWGAHGDMTRQVFTQLSLRHDHEHPQVMRRFDLVHELIDEVVGDRIEVHAEGDSALAQFFDLVLIGDFVTYHLAQELEIDPGPVDALTNIKNALRA